MINKKIGIYNTIDSIILFIEKSYSIRQEHLSGFLKIILIFIKKTNNQYKLQNKDFIIHFEKELIQKQDSFNQKLINNTRKVLYILLIQINNIFCPKSTRGRYYFYKTALILINDDRNQRKKTLSLQKKIEILNKKIVFSYWPLNYYFKYGHKIIDFDANKIINLQQYVKFAEKKLEYYKKKYTINKKVSQKLSSTVFNYYNKIIIKFNKYIKAEYPELFESLSFHKKELLIVFDSNNSVLLLVKDSNKFEINIYPFYIDIELMRDLAITHIFEKEFNR